MTALSPTTLQPVFNKEAMLCVLSCDDAYAPYAAICVLSLLEHAKEGQSYDIVILHEGLSHASQSLLANLANNKVFISIRFFSVQPLFESFTESLPLSSYISKAAYYRFFISHIFSAYSRVLYLDCDMVLDGDISPLYYTDFEGASIVAVQDYMITFRYTFEGKVQKHLDNVLKLKNPKRYFNSGMLLFNLEALQEIDILQEGMKLLETLPKLRWHDQDLLNCVFHDKTKLVSPKWNYLVETDPFGLNEGSLFAEFESLDESELLNQERKVQQRPVIIHYGGRKKPWHDSQVFMSERFWFYAEKSPVNEELSNNVLARLENAIKKDNQKVLFYRLLALCTSGNLKKIYKAKYFATKAAIKASKIFLQRN